MPSPAGHMLAGAILGAAQSHDLKSINYKKIVVGAVVSAAPDMDILLTFLGIEYIYAHRTITHSLVTVAMVFVLLWGGNYSPLVKRLKFYPIPYVFVTICLFSHIGLDLLGEDTYGPKGLMVFWPISSVFFYPDFPVFDALFSDEGRPIPLVAVLFAVVKEFVIIGFAGFFLLFLYWKSKKILPYCRYGKKCKHLQL